MSIEIDAAYAMELLDKAVNEKGWEHVDQNAGGKGCRNVEWNEEGTERRPSCIVGHALYYAGVTLEALASCDGAVQSTVAGLGQHMDIEVTTNAMVIFHTAQYAQDSGESWGRAITKARGVFYIFQEADEL